MSYLSAVSRKLLGDTEETHANLSQDSRYVGRDSNRDGLFVTSKTGAKSTNMESPN
jgi:hypothetical protein